MRRFSIPFARVTHHDHPWSHSLHLHTRSSCAQHTRALHTTSCGCSSTQQALVTLLRNNNVLNQRPWKHSCEFCPKQLPARAFSPTQCCIAVVHVNQLDDAGVSEAGGHVGNACNDIWPGSDSGFHSSIAQLSRGIVTPTAYTRGVQKSTHVALCGRNFHCADNDVDLGIEFERRDRAPAAHNTCQIGCVEQQARKRKTTCDGTDVE